MFEHGGQIFEKSLPHPIPHKEMTPPRGVILAIPVDGFQYLYVKQNDKNNLLYISVQFGK